jgi:RHS repeat-associated protein
MTKSKTKLSLFLFTLLFFFSNSVAPVLAAVSYLYDANGNMTSDGTQCYTYNDANQLVQVKNCSNNQVIAQYVYDYQGNRITKKLYNNGNLQKTVYSPNDGYETVKLASNGAVQNTSYYQVNDQQVAKKNPDGTKNYYLNDNLGSTNVLANQTGGLVERTTYYPYGEFRSGGTKSKFEYTGQENDPETNLDYYNARYYNAHIMHFTQPDDVIPNQYDPQTLNRYAYARNNPLVYTDPTGHFFGIDDALEVLFVTAVVIPVVEEIATNPEVDIVAEEAGGEISSAVEGGVAELGNVGGKLSEKASSLTEDLPISGDQYTSIGSTGKFGEAELQAELNATEGESQVYTPVNGFSYGRRLDFLQTDQEGLGVANEAKTGYQSLTSTIQTQIAKDQALLNDPESGIDSYTWHFYRSPVTGLVGGSQQLYNALDEAGIGYKIH